MSFIITPLLGVLMGPVSTFRHTFTKKTSTNHPKKRFFYKIVKIKNLTNAEVHEFHSHTKPVTALAVYPYGPLIVSCALDYTVRMYSLKSFREVYRYVCLFLFVCLFVVCLFRYIFVLFFVVVKNANEKSFFYGSVFEPPDLKTASTSHPTHSPCTSWTTPNSTSKLGTPSTSGISTTSILSLRLSSTFQPCFFHFSKIIEANPS